MLIIRLKKKHKIATLKAIIGFKLHDIAAVSFDDRLNNRLHATDHGKVIHNAARLWGVWKADHVEHQYGACHAMRGPNRVRYVLAIIVIRRVCIGEQQIV